MEVNQYFYSLAKISSQKAAENGVHVDPKFIYTQWYIETEGFTSQLQASHHSLGGVMDTDGSWRHFNDFIDFANYFGNYLTYYREDGMTNANSLYNYVAALHHGGYFTADFDTYYSAVLQVFNTINF